MLFLSSRTFATAALKSSSQRCFASSMAKAVAGLKGKDFMSIDQLRYVHRNRSDDDAALDDRDDDDDDAVDGYGVCLSGSMVNCDAREVNAVTIYNCLIEYLYMIH
jgi:hypothetical protein